MDQEKIGKFIAKCRKNKNMTQQELADKLGITDRAISHWENGRSIPDASLYKRLCKELDISIEELINGEKDNSNKAKEKAIITTIKEKDKVKKKSKIILISLFIIFILIIFGLIYYNKKVKLNLVNDSDYLYDEVIEFIRNEEFKTNYDIKYKDFNVFYSYHGFGIEKKNNYKYVYMWIYEQSYYIEYQDVLAISSSSSTPVKAIFKDNKIQEIIYPENGKNYIESIKKMFPDIIEQQVLNFDKEENISKLFNEVEQKKNIYYNYLNLDMSKITIDDLSYDNLIFSVTYKKSKCDIPVVLNIYKNNKYTLATDYKACKKGTVCNAMLKYTKHVEGTYDYDIIEIIRHSVDANMHQYTNDNLPVYDISSGKGHLFITDENNKYLKELLTLINVDLKECAIADYK